MAGKYALGQGQAATVELVKEQVGRERFDQVGEFERGLGQDQGLSW